MRVIAGEFRGRKLKPVPGKQTRPTSGKVREAVFQMMGPFFQGGSCLDLFAGSGSLGIEAISRGIDNVVFIDKNSKAIHTIHENIKAMKIEEQTKVSRMDALKALHIIAENKKQFDLILIDPPYDSTDYDELLNVIERLDLLKENGIIYCEHNMSNKLPQSLTSLTVIKHANYGSETAITLYQ